MAKVVNPEQWVKEHKKEFVNRLIGPYLTATGDIPVAFFMAGLPGAGKTEFTKGFIQSTSAKLLRLDMDEIASQIRSYKPQAADQFRKGATILLENAFNTSINKKLNFIMDGTFGGPKALLNIDRCLKRGYLVKVIYLYQDPKVAWNFTVARERIEHRAINMGGFIDTYFRVLANITALLQETSDHLSVNLVVKDSSNSIREKYNDITIRKFDEICKLDYNRDTLRNYING